MACSQSPTDTTAENSGELGSNKAVLGLEMEWESVDGTISEKTRLRSQIVWNRQGELKHHEKAVDGRPIINRHDFLPLISQRF